MICKRFLLPTVILAAAMALTGCGSDAALPPPASTPDQVVAQVASALADSENVDKVIYNQFESGNYTVGYIERQTFDSGVRLQAEMVALDVVKVLKRSTVHPPNIAVVAMYAMTDDYGNTKLQPAVALGYTQATLDQMNPEGISYENVMKVADTQIIHPGY